MEKKFFLNAKNKNHLASDCLPGTNCGIFVDKSHILSNFADSITHQNATNSCDFHA